MEPPSTPGFAPPLHHSLHQQQQYQQRQPQQQQQLPHPAHLHLQHQVHQQSYPPIYHNLQQSYQGVLPEHHHPQQQLHHHHQHQQSLPPLTPLSHLTHQQPGSSNAVTTHHGYGLAPLPPTAGSQLSPLSPMDVGINGEVGRGNDMYRPQQQHLHQLQHHHASSGFSSTVSATNPTAPRRRPSVQVSTTPLQRPHPLSRQQSFEATPLTPERDSGGGLSAAREYGGGPSPSTRRRPQHPVVARMQSEEKEGVLVFASSPVDESTGDDHSNRAGDTRAEGSRERDGNRDRATRNAVRSAGGLAAEGAAEEGEAARGSDDRLPRQSGTKIMADPPRLQEWRERLFNVDDTIVMTHEEFETYFPHIDNVYSHRSTQRYKRKPFVSHYWDCRMKGRPPGTPKSDDPSKKKRKRQARERDLCDVKIKITEHFEGASLNLLEHGMVGRSNHSSSTGGDDGPAGSLSPFPPSSAGPDGQRFWTIQRVNGTGGNGKGDGVAGPHKHTLARSDEIKKSSAQRWLALQDKGTKKTQKPPQRRPTGNAASTAKKCANESDMKLYAACFCPFSQRVWIALEAKGIPYQYCEIDPFRRPTQLLEANPRGLVPAIREGDWACGESAVIIEYLEDVDGRVRLYPTEPRLKANCRLWIDHINSRIVPAFYFLLHAADAEKQDEGIERLQREITALVNGADEQGPYFLGSELCVVDVHFAPFAIRLSRILTPYRGWTDAAPGTRWQQWVEAIEQNQHVQATTSGRDLYLDTIDLLINSRKLFADVP